MLWPLLQICGLICIPLAALQAIQLSSVLQSERFTYRPLWGNGVPTTRTEKPGWYLYLVVSKFASLVLSLAVIGFVAFWTFHRR
jgi:hypothetical protein